MTTVFSKFTLHNFDEKETRSHDHEIWFSLSS